jgi:hypothetical protein
MIGANGNKPNQLSADWARLAMDFPALRLPTFGCSCDIVGSGDILGHMSRISIDVTKDQHRRLKALAALKGVSLKDYLLSNALDSREKGDREALAELESFLDDRVRKAREGKISRRNVTEIFKQAYREANDQAGS